MTTTTTAPTMTAPPAVARRIFNFSAGPAILPEPVIREAQGALWSVAGSGIGICEHSHRGKVFVNILEETEADCRKVGNISDEYAIVFLQGGASTQFATIPMNFLSQGQTADYLHTGEWTKKAVKEAKLFGNVNLAFDGNECDFDHVPQASEVNLTSGAAYTWYCDNNTIYGTEYTVPPQSSTPLVCDASSNIFSRPIEVSQHAIVFAGAQKNLGPAGCTLVIIRKDMLDTSNDGLPSMFTYKNHVEKDSCLNTPPCFSIYVMGLVFKWILAEGGLSEMARRNEGKAKIVYNAIDQSGGFYQPVAQTGSRSRMNVTFRTPNEDLDKLFINEAAANEMSGLKGHRSVGGLRASIYNAFPIAGCETLAQFMADFAGRNG